MCKYKRQIKQQAQNNSTVSRVIVMFCDEIPMVFFRKFFRRTQASHVWHFSSCTTCKFKTADGNRK